MSDVKVPEMGESIVEGTISKWLVKEGDTVNQGDVLAELETDKVNMEISAEESGIVEKLLSREGDTVAVGETIARIGAGGGTDSGSKQASGGGADKAEGESGKPDASEVAKQNAGEDAPAKSADGSASEHASADSGRDASAQQLAGGKQQERHEGQSGGGESGSQADQQEKREEAGSASYNASPGARKLAREKGIDLGQVRTQDPMGRIRSEDVEAFAERGNSASAGERSPAGQPKPQADGNRVAETSQPTAAGNRTEGAAKPQAGGGQQPAKPSAAAHSAEEGKPVERRKMSRRRITIASRLVEAQRTAAMLTTFNEIDMTAVLDIRKRRKQSFTEKHNIGLGFMSFFTKAVVGALKAFPLLNAEIQGDEILVKNYYDIGIAVSAKEGLVVPVVRNADRLGFADIEKQIAGLAEKARSNTLALGDLQGGTFTITNGGVFGSLLSTPILNAPQVGILGMHKIQLRPIAIDEERMENRPMMYVALSYDHRIVDGAEAVRFLVLLKQLLEDPETLLLEG